MMMMHACVSFSMLKWIPQQIIFHPCFELRQLMNKGAQIAVNNSVIIGNRRCNSHISQIVVSICLINSSSEQICLSNQRRVLVAVKSRKFVRWWSKASPTSHLIPVLCILPPCHILSIFFFVLSIEVLVITNQQEI